MKTCNGVFVQFCDSIEWTVQFSNPYKCDLFILLSRTLGNFLVVTIRVVINKSGLRLFTFLD